MINKKKDVVGKYSRAILDAQSIKQLGFNTYLKDLPKLVEDKQAGRMIAYHGEKQVGIANTDEELQKKLLKLQHYGKTKEELFVTRIIENDLEDHNIPANPPRPAHRR